MSLEFFEKLNRKYNFKWNKIGVIEYDGDMGSDEFLVSLEDYIDELNSVSEEKYNLHFTYNIDLLNRIFLFPDYYSDEYIGDWFE